MHWLTHFARSSIGAKMLIGITGIGLVLFLIVHMFGNLQIFVGPDAINGYAAKLRGIPLILWGARIALLLFLFLHVVRGVGLTLHNRAARPEGYRQLQHLATGWSARSMIWSGVAIALFVVYHLAHFTLLVTNYEYRAFVDAEGRHDVYRMMVVGFQNPGISVLYIAAVAAVCLHLSHAVPSFFQSLGIRHPKYSPMLERLGPALAWLLFIGFVSVPISVMVGWVGGGVA